MINCPKCGADNMIGAIFCRTCGEKLNLDDLSPEVFDAPKEPVFAKVGRIAQRVAIVVIVTALVVLGGGLFWPSSIIYDGAGLSQEALSLAQRKYKGLGTPERKMPQPLKVSSDEATAALKEALQLPATSGGNRKAQMLSVEFMSSGNCKFILKSLLFGQIPMYTIVIARPSVETPGDVNLEILKVTMGKLPLPGNLRKFGLDQFNSLNLSSVLGPAESHITEIEVSEDSCAFTWKR